MSPAVKSAQVNFDLLFKNHPLPMWIYDLKTLAFLEVNDAAVKKYGYSKKKFLSMTLKDIRPKEDVPRLLNDVSKKRPSFQQSGNWRHKLKSGKVIDVEITSHTIKYNGRKAALVIAQDVTEKTFLYKKLTEAESEIRTTIYSIGDAVISVNIKSCIVMMNPVAEKLTGWKETDAKGKPLSKVFKIVNEDTRKIAENPVSRVLREGIVVGLANHTLLISKVGKEIPIADSGAPIKDYGGKIIGVVLVFRDQRKEREAQRKIEDAKIFAESIIATVREPLIVLNSKMLVITANRSFYQKFNTVPAETENQLFFKLGHGQWNIPALKKLLNEILPLNTSFNDFEIQHKFSEIGERTLLLNARRIYREGNKTQMILLAIEDITERQTSQKRITKLNKIYNVLSNVNQAIVRIKDADNLFKEICRIVVDEGKFAMAWIGIVNPAANKVDVAASSGDTFNYLNTVNIDLNDPKRSQGPTGICIKTGVHQINNDLVNNPKFLVWRKSAIKSGLRSSASFPLIVSKKVIGIFNIYSNEVGFFDKDEIKLFDELAVDISFALEFIEGEKARQKAEYSLKLSETTYRGIINSITEAIYIQDENGIFLDVNSASEKMYGYKRDYFIGRTPEFLSAPGKNDLEKVKQAVQKAYNGIPQKFEFWGIDKDGRVFPKDVSLSGGIYFGKKAVIAVARDITERKQAEQQLAASETRLRTIIEAEPECVKVIALDGTILSMNPTGLKMIEADSTEQVIGKSLYSLIVPEYLQKFRDLNERVCNGAEETLQFEIIGMKGTRRWLETHAVPYRDDKGRISGILGITLDITERKRAEEKLLESENRFRLIWEKSKDGMRLTNEEGFVLLANDAYCKLVEKPQSEIEGKLMSVVQNISRQTEILRKHKERFQSRNVPVYLEKKITLWNGTEKYLELSNTFLEIPNQPALLLTIFRDVTERKSAEEKLRESEERFRNLVENINDVFYITDKEGKIFYCSPNLTTTTGFSMREILGNSYLRLIAPIDRRIVIDHYLEQTAKGHSDTSMEFRVRRKDGRIIWAEQITHIVRNTFGDVLEYRNVARDITKRKLVETELRKSREDLVKFFEDDLSADFIATPSGQLLNCNNTFIKMFGFKSKEEALAFPIDKLYRDLNSRNEFIDLLKKNKKVENFEGEYIALDGRTIYTIENAVAEFDESGEFNQIRGYIVDITERKIVEEEIKKLSRAVEQSPASVLITNKNGDIEYVNKKFCDVTGFSREEVIGKNPRILKSGYHDKHFYEDFWNQILSGNEWNGEMRNKKKNGELYWESVLVSPLLNKEGDITNFVAVKEDVTEKKMMIEELIYAIERAESSNKLKDAFIANISHEIRTPLNGILGLTSIIKETYAEFIKREDEELFDGIDYSSKRIIRTVDMILNYSRIQTGEFPVNPQEIEISLICENLIGEFTTAAKNKLLKLSFENRFEKAITIFGDEYSITHSISNLIDNAIKYTNIGFVEVILYSGNNDEILLDVKDSGIGISEEYLPHIFEPYRQEQMGYGRAYEGVGLGLSIVKKFLDLNSAKISVASKKGKGTTFTINFGKSLNHSAPKINEEKINKINLIQSSQNKPLVLIVENDLINQSTIKRFIENGYNTIMTDSSDGALELLQSHKVDLILMDISIKGNKNGLELTKELKSSKDFSHLPIIVVTAHASERDRQNSIDAGSDDYIPKPFTREELLDKIGRFV